MSKATFSVFVFALSVWFVPAASASDSGGVGGFPPDLPVATLVIEDATVATLQPGFPTAQAVAVRGDRIIGVGSNASMRRYVGSATRVLDVHGAFVTPGFIEGHGHLMMTGEALDGIDAGAARSWDDLVAMVAAAVRRAKPGQWITGYGWQQAKWSHIPEPNVGGLPLPQKLDAVSPNNPVMLTQSSGHGVYVNAAALRAAGITDSTPSPAGGEILHDTNGHVVGWLADNAEDPVDVAYRRYLSELPAKERDERNNRILGLAVSDAVKHGITTFVDQGETFKRIDWLRVRAPTLPIRLYVNVDGESVSSLDKRLAKYKIDTLINNHFAVLGIGETVFDGALGSETAWFYDGYANRPGYRGSVVHPLSELRAMSEIAARDGFQVSIHAIGDRANKELLDMYAQVFAEDPAAQALRWRDEHAQHVRPQDIPRFAKLGVIASMQSIHACSDAPFVVPRIGDKRAETETYVWRKLIDAGTMVLDGTDTPVEGIDPIPGFYCAITRAYQHDGRLVTFYPSEAKTREEELRSYTWNNAYAIFQEDNLGSVSVGKVADLDVFSGDLLTEPVQDILRTRVLYTIVGGKIVYERPAAGAWSAGQLFPPTPEFDHVQ